ncbi:Serine/threonine-protein phosphatase 6 regulatory ankyrin repeat subunit B [Trichoderma lentiforme]|uniref:Serine/threonine-protein phosphatase 6 regulatory ankyrin repeat subunit B n=1 Tax=Trichoderma lentiforme TaxID=1567552 RepID=A0A9P4X760_9HYPO|nr:Serine/threonine-protein phosphatase 6 regulatory ankyrin repeat subunit B [Trichoderma lentiforme]
MARFKRNRAHQPQPRPAKPTAVPKPTKVSRPIAVSKPTAVSKSTAASSLCSLPPELFDRILSEVTSGSDLNSLSRCSHGLYWAVSDFLYTKTLGKEMPHKGVCDDECGDECDDALALFFVHAVRHDSGNLIKWLIFREHGSRLRGLFPWNENFTYLHYALLQDAPKVAIQLLKHGAELNENEALYPDLQHLYLALPQLLSNRIGSFDGPLRIACSYALPRIAEYLLIRGADPNAHSNFGLAAIHIAVRHKLPWSQFELFTLLNQVADKSCESVDKRNDSEENQKGEKDPNNFGGETKSQKMKAQFISTKVQEKDSTFSPWGEPEDTQEKDFKTTQWEARVLQTVEVLLRFGADCNLLALDSCHHQCGPKCWKSFSCAPIDRRVLHFAAASGHTSVVSALVKRKAKVFQADGQGNLPVVHAMAQDHDEIVAFLLKKMERFTRLRSHRGNLIVCETTRSTVLHIACRFGHLTVVKDLIKKGADVNGVDLRGRTPLHEAVGQTAPDLEKRLVETLYLLAENNNANQEIIDYDGRRAGDLGAKHRLGGVRALFEYATMARYDWQRLTEPQMHGRASAVNNVPSPDPSWFVNEEPDIPPPIRHDLAPKKAPIWVKKEGFPSLKAPGAPRKVAEPPLNRKNSVAGPRMVDRPPNRKNSVASLRIVDRPPNKKQSVARPRMALKLLDTVEPVKPTEMAEIEEPTGTEKPIGSEKKGQRGGRKKWNRVSLK